ncbi:MAG: hypothetical protein ACRD8W_12785 [Nitrososphaeraceae archaeon]
MTKSAARQTKPHIQINSSRAAATSSTMQVIKLMTKLRTAVEEGDDIFNWKNTCHNKCIDAVRLSLPF